MFRRLLARFRRRPRDYTPRHSIGAPPPPPMGPTAIAALAPIVTRRVPPPPPPPAQVLPDRRAAAAASATPGPIEAGDTYLAGGARVGFVLSDGSPAHPELDQETSSRMDYVVRNLLGSRPVRRTT